VVPSATDSHRTLTGRRIAWACALIAWWCIPVGVVTQASAAQDQLDREGLAIGPMPRHPEPAAGIVGANQDDDAPLGSPEAPSPMSLGSSALRTAGALGAVLAVMVGLAMALRRVSSMGAGGAGVLGSLGAGGRAPSGVLLVLGRYPTGRGQQLVLIKLDRRILLLSQQTGFSRKGGGPAWSTLCEITDPEEVASLLIRTQDERQASIAAGFEQALTRHQETFDRGYDEPGDEPATLDLRVGDDGPVGALRRRLDGLRGGARPRAAGVGG